MILMNIIGRLRSLSRLARLTLLLHTVFAFTSSIGGVFFNVYLWRTSDSLIPIAKYQFFYWLTLVLGYILIGYWFKGKGVSRLFRISFLGHFIFYIAVIILGEKAGGLVELLGVMGGFAASFYWSAHSVMVFSGTEDKLREIFYGVLGSLGSFANVVGPALAGYLIWAGSKFNGKGFAGYYLLFGLLAAVFLLSEFAIRRIKDVTFEKFSLSGSLRLFKEKPIWRLNLIRSFYDGLMVTRGFLWSVLSFVILKNELRLGLAMSAFALLAVLTNPIIGFIYKPVRRLSLNSLGMAFLVLAGILYPLLLNPAGLIVDKVLGEAIGWPLFALAWLSFFFLIIEKDEGGKSRQFEYFTSFEIFQGMGRILSIGLFIAFFDATSQITFARWWFGALSLLFIPIWWFIRKIRVKLVEVGYKEE